MSAQAAGIPVSASILSDSSSIQGVLVSPCSANTGGQCHDAMLEHHQVNTYLVDEAWKSLPLPKPLGLPLKFIKWPSSNGTANYNHLIQVLSTDADCSRSTESLQDSGFGQTPYPPIRGGIMLVREDWKPLEVKHVEVLAKYIDTHLVELIKFGGGRWKHKTLDEVKKFQRSIEDKVKPKAFMSFWHRYQATQIDAGAKDWQDLECPVKDEADSSES